VLSIDSFATGLEITGIYRLSGNDAQIQKLWHRKTKVCTIVKLSKALFSTINFGVLVCNVTWVKTQLWCIPLDKKMYNICTENYYNFAFFVLLPYHNANVSYVFNFMLNIH